MSDTLPPVPDKSQRAQRRVKPVSRKGDKFERLRSLDCFKEIHDMICTGWPLSEVAKFIQKNRKEYTDIEEISLVWILNAYRKSLPPTDLVAPTMGPTFEKAAQKVRDGLDVLAEMEKLYGIQMKRIEIDHAIELKVKKLFPTMTQEVKAARELLESYQRIKQDLGLDERHLGTLTVSTDEVATRYGKPGVRKALENPQSRRKLLSLAERFVRIQDAREKMDEKAEEEGAVVEARTEDPMSAEDMDEGLLVDDEQDDAMFDLASDPDGDDEE